MVPILFLDIDGVLHPDDAAEIVIEGGQWRVTGEGLFRWAPLLMDLIVPHDGQIVIHSAWRHFYRLHELKAFFPEACRDRIVGVTQGGGRYQSILNFVVARGVERFLVLDDAKSEFPEDWMHQAHCPGTRGISDRGVQQIVSELLALNVQSTRDLNS